MSRHQDRDARAVIRLDNWVRGGAAFPSSPNVITSHDAIIEIAALGISLSLSEIYSDIGTS